MKKIKAGNARGYIISGVVYPTKDAMLTRLRDILYTSPPNTPITGESLRILIDVLSYHPRAEAKQGCGIARMEVRKNYRFGTLEFWIVRLDGTETDWSFMACLRPSSPLQHVQMAARHAVVPQIAEFKRLTFVSSATVQCPLTGDSITYNTCHVDHIPPDTFASILDGFLREYEIDTHDVIMLGDEDGAIGRVFADQSLSIKWQSYHAQHARLRATSSFGNLSISKRAANQRCDTDV